MGADDIGLHLLDSAAMPVDLSIPRAHHEVTLTPAVLDRCVGRYRYSPTDTITVTRAGSHLAVALSTGEKLDFFPESEREFFARAIDVQITFEAPPNESANAAIWHQAGDSQRGERLAEARTNAR